MGALKFLAASLGNAVRVSLMLGGIKGVPSRSPAAESRVSSTLDCDPLGLKLEALASLESWDEFSTNGWSSICAAAAAAKSLQLCLTL